jgi:hypothetical protein
MKNPILILFFSLTVFTQCKKDNGSSILDGPWVDTQKELITLHTRPPGYGSGDSPDQANIDSTLSHQNAFILLINQRLNTSFAQTLEIYLYNKYEVESKLGVQAGGSTNPKRKEIYYSFGYYQYYPNLKLYDYLGVHEMVHMVAENSIGTGGTTMMIEGLAVAIDGTLGNVGANRKLITEWMSEFRNVGKIYSPSQLLEKLSTINDVEFYAQSGNFVSWLLLKFGIEKTKQLYLLDKAHFISDFEKITGQTFNSMESNYLDETRAKP